MLLNLINPRPYILVLLAAIAALLSVGCVGSRTVADDTIYSYERWEADRRELSPHEVKAHRAFFRQHIMTAHEAAKFTPEQAEEAAQVVASDESE